MQTLKQDVMDAISKMPDPVEVDDIMYRLYVIDKIRKGREASARGEVIAIEALKKEVESW